MALRCSFLSGCCKTCSSHFKFELGRISSSNRCGGKVGGDVSGHNVAPTFPRHVSAAIATTSHGIQMVRWRANCLLSQVAHVGVAIHARMPSPYSLCLSRTASHRKNTTKRLFVWLTCLLVVVEVVELIALSGDGCAAGCGGYGERWLW